MATKLDVPRDLRPSALVYQGDLPSVLMDIVEEGTLHWRRGNISNAIRCATRAEVLAKEIDEKIGISIVCIWLADLYRLLHQIGPAMTYCQEAADALKLMPTYQHRDHAHGVVTYLQGLLYHELGDSTKALSYYHQALASFNKAVAHWRSKVTQDDEGFEVKCKRVIKWIKVLARRLASDLSPIDASTLVHLPVVNNDDYELAQFKVTVNTLASGMVIDGRRYRVYRMDGSLEEPTFDLWLNTQYFLMRVEDNEWGGTATEPGDYILIQCKNTVEPDDIDAPPRLEKRAGVVWKEEDGKWQAGDFVRDHSGKIQFRPIPARIIGGEEQKETIGDREVGIAFLLLKPV